MKNCQTVLSEKADFKPLRIKNNWPPLNINLNTDVNFSNINAETLIYSESGQQKAQQQNTVGWDLANLARKAEKHVLLRRVFHPFSGRPIKDGATFPKPGFLHAISSAPQPAFRFNQFKVARISYVHSNKSSNPQQPTRYKSNSNETRISKQRTKHQSS